ncbi:Cellulose synthase-like B3, putative isoform 1 [Theobroma cacao]|uniref:Cellulose synthase-like B3, putative isoform 1 n=1 Tax=Theobroma cacao TaxID=3641 RepID=A0A061DKG8_THECC|nr:Cellulose synthase-like B3, putative isoform 1 [Theobroma cacao]
MADELFVPLYEKIARKNTIQRSLDITLLFLLVSLLGYRLFCLNNHGLPWFIALVCELWFTFNWVLVVNCKWSPVEYKTYPENLERRFPELPNVDMFVTTADPVLEPPIIAVNNVLSLLAADYPADKLACYVSDDGCFPLTFYSLVEASKFAKLWVPFCKKYKIQVRAPFRYFFGDSEPSSTDGNLEFQQDWLKMKAEYEVLARKIEEAARKSVPCDLTGDFAVFCDVERRNHPTIIKIIVDNKEIHSNAVVPNFVYISREKAPKQPHHYKAGAMNVLTRVSGVMTNAPFILNVDCDMFVNNPQVFRHAMCQLLGSKNERETAFVQYPQVFYDGLRDDPYGNQFVVPYQYMCRGIAGIQGPFYGGTGCFHRRKVIYGVWPRDRENEARNCTSINGKSVDDTLLNEFGNSEELINSAVQALKGKKGFPNNLSNSLEAACKVASCSYEYGTSWGTKCGWIYGATAEDLLTGLKIHAKGWNSALHMPELPGFMGCTPSGGPEAMAQQKRWATGLAEILVGKNCPIIATLTAKLQFRMCLAYLWILFWGLRSIPQLCYAALPAYCILANSHFLPKVEEPAIWIPIATFVTYNLHTLREYLKAGLSIRAWWNNLRMGSITATSAYLFGLFAAILKLLRISETVFEVTQKDQSCDGDDPDVTKFTFNESAVFVPGTTLLLVHLISLLCLSSKLPTPVHDMHGVGLGEVFCSLWVVLCFWPFLNGLFERGKYGIPLSTILKSAALALLFVHFCRT